jgi:hypothetical protein
LNLENLTMNITTLKIFATPAVAPQRGANWGAALFVAAWRGLERLLGTAPRKLTRAEEAAEVREMAWRLRDSDPGFAADLMAAADRHEAIIR